MLRWILASLIAVTSTFLLSCANDENDDLAEAQECLDKITETNYPDAEKCFAKIKKYDSQQANILKCSAKFLAGGLTTSKIVDAYKELEKSDDESDSKEAIFISYLALNPSSKAKEAAPFCRKTKLEGFIYLGELAVVGSILADALPAGFSNPPTEAEVEAALTECQTNPSSCDPEELAGAVESVAEIYCDKPSAESDEICQDITAAINEAGGNNADLTEALTCLLAGKEYNNGTCS